MVIVSDNALNNGLAIASAAAVCNNSHRCFWGRQSEWFKIDTQMANYCLKEKCPVIVCRQAFESSSPAYYNEARQLSQYEILFTAKKQFFKRKRSDVQKFTQLAIVLIHPLSVAYGKIPFLRPQEIEELKKKFTSKEEVEQTLTRIERMNKDWYDWLDVLLCDLFYQYAYSSALILLAYLFFNGIEKDRLPDMKNPEEKEQLFKEIEKVISRNNKTD
jgi:hypothetical protein